jgi:citrate lyase subunit beta/citryl-CoA lyase
MTYVWRSLQYVPAHVEKYVSNPRIREADGVILDLEDSVPVAEKARARAALATAVTLAGAGGGDVLVRINDGDLADADLVAAVRPGVRALVIPKVANAEALRRLDARVAGLEHGAGLEPGAIRFVVLIETADGFLDMAGIASACPRVAAINLGAEDFATDIGMACSEETLLGPRQHMAIVAAAAGVMPLGLMGPATRFDDLDGYRELAERSRRFGYVGSTCIHPSQIAVLNAAFSPTPEEVAQAARVVAAAQEADRDGRGAFAIDGRMIDAPIVARAEALLQRHHTIEARTGSSKGGVSTAG